MSLALTAPGGITRADLDDIRALNAEDSLLDFIRFTWSAVEPARPFVGGWVIEAICEHLEAVTAGEISRLIINVPPGTMKSLTSSVFWPAWEWLRTPHLRYVCASYSSDLTERDNGRMCQLIHSPLYRRFWSDRFKANESRVKVMNDKTGWKLATSVGGVGTGERGDRVIIDDAISVKQANSEIVRSTMQGWVRETMPTRMTDPRTAAIIAIEQRTHEDDCTGTLLKDGGDYVHLMIPMEWDGRRYSTGIGWTDPRSVEDIGDEGGEWWKVRGELCFPERFPAWVVERDKKAMGSYAVAGQFQQAPAPRGGGIIKREWWQSWEPPMIGKALFPSFDAVVAFYDGAHTTLNQNDPCAMAVFGTFTDQRSGMSKLMMVRCWAERLAINDALKRINDTCQRYRVDVLLVENKANGHDVVSELFRLKASDPEFSSLKCSIVLADPRGSVQGRGGYDKVARAMSVVPVFEDEMVYAPRIRCRNERGVPTDETDWVDWASAAIDECAVFPRGSHDDQVDCIVGAIRWMRDQGMLLRVVEAVTADRDRAMDEDSRGRAQPLYRC